MIVSLQLHPYIQKLLSDGNRIRIRISETLLSIFWRSRLLEKVAHCTIIHLLFSEASFQSSLPWLQDCPWCNLSSDGVSRLGLDLETSLETHFSEFRSRRFQVSSRSRSRRFQVSRLWILQRNGCLLYLQVRNNQNISEKCQKLEKNKSEARASAETFPGGANLIFCLSFPCYWQYNANGHSQNVLPFLHHNENAPLLRRGVTRGARGEQFPGRRITMWAP